MVFECTTAGGVATVWQGSIFNCERMTNSISLRHSQFNNIETVVGVCNGGNIEAQAISMHGSNYTSQLNITIDTSMLGHAIQCAHDDGRDVNVIGQKTLTIDEGKRDCYITVICIIPVPNLFIILRRFPKPFQFRPPFRYSPKH